MQEPHPQIQLWSDLRLTDGGIAPLEERPGLLEVPVLPGDYFLLVYNRAADAMDYQLRMQLTAGGSTAARAARVQRQSAWNPLPASRRLRRR